MAVVHGERARRTAGERRRGVRDACSVRPVRSDLVPDHDHHQPEGVTLDDVLSGAWEALSRHDPATCPVCGQAMRPRYATGPVPTGGRCTGCQTTIQ